MGSALKGALVGRILRHACLAISLLTLSTGITMIPTEELSAQPSPALMSSKTMMKIKKWAISSVIAIPLLYAGITYVPPIAKQLLTPAQEQTGEGYLDTIIRFEDEIIGEDFYYIHNGREGDARAIEWNPPYNDIMLETTLGDLFAMPVSALKGKRLDFHVYEGADVVYVSPNDDLYRGVILEVYDNQVLKVLTQAKLKNLHTVSEDQDFVKTLNYINFTDTVQLEAELY